MKYLVYLLASSHYVRSSLIILMDKSDSFMLLLLLYMHL